MTDLAAVILAPPELEANGQCHVETPIRPSAHSTDQ